MHMEKCTLTIMQKVSISSVFYTAKQLWKAYAAAWKNVILYIVKKENKSITARTEANSHHGIPASKQF